MKPVIFILMLLLFACGNEELTKLNESLVGQKTELEQQLKAVSEERDKLSSDLQQMEAMKEEMETLRASAEEAVKGLETAKATQKQTVRELNKKLEEAGKDSKKMTFLSKKIKGITATIVTNMGEIKIKFFPDQAPIHCYNFITRAECGFYDKTQFHRVIPGFMIQGGDSNSRDMNFSDDGGGGTVVAIPHEFNKKRHSRGILSMARRGDTKYGAGSQFFLMHADSPQLDNKYTVFGEITKGLEVVDQIAGVKKNRRDHPIEPVWIETIKVQ